MPRIVGRLTIACLAWLVVLGVDVRRAHADPAPGLVVDGQTLVAPGRLPERRGDTWFVPLAPVVDALQGSMTYDSYSQVITLSLPGGTVTVYNGLTGEVARDLAPVEVLAPGLPLGTHERDLIVPLELATSLLQASGRVDPLTDAIHIVTDSIDPESLQVEMPTLGLQEVRYTASATEAGGQRSGALTLESRTRVGRGLATAHVSGSGTDPGELGVRRMTLAYDDGDRRRYTLGDLRGDPGLDWLRAQGRGVDATQDIGEGGRITLGYTRLTAGSGSVTGPDLDEHALRLGIGWEGGLDLGAMWIGRGDERREGLLLAAQHQARSDRLTARILAGGYVSPDDNLARRLSGEIQSQWTPAEPTLVFGRVGHYGSEFERPGSFSAAGTSFYQLGVNQRLGRSVSLSTAHGLSHRSVARTTDRTYGASLGWAGRVATLTSAVATVSASHGDLAPHRVDLAVDLRGRFALGKWSWGSRRPLDRTGSVTSTGVLETASRAGTHQLAASWSNGHFSGASALWSPPVRRLPQLNLSAGVAWSRPASSRQRGLTAQLRLGYERSGHRAGLSLEQQPSRHQTRLDWRGRFTFEEGSSRPLRPGVADALRPGNVTGRAFLDRNLNGRFDEGERVLAGVAVVLDDGMDRRITDDDGRYRFDSLRPGRHTIRLDGRSLRADLSILGPLERELVLPALATVTFDFRAAVNRRVTGRVYVDVNGNDRRDDGEPLVPDALVMVAGAGDTMSHEDGRFRLADIPPGRHALRIAPGSLSPDLIAPAPVQIEVPGSRDLGDVEIGVVPRPREIVRKRF